VRALFYLARGHAPIRWKEPNHFVRNMMKKPELSAKLIVNSRLQSQDYLVIGHVSLCFLMACYVRLPSSGRVFLCGVSLTSEFAAQTNKLFRIRLLKNYRENNGLGLLG